MAVDFGLDFCHDYSAQGLYRYHLICNLKLEKNYEDQWFIYASYNYKQTRCTLPYI